MTDQLDALPQSVREAVEEIDSGVVCRSPAWETIRAELIRLTARVQELERENAILEIKNRGTLANNLCPDHRDKQTGKPCLACTIETLTRKKDRAEAELAAIKTAARAYFLGYCQDEAADEIVEGRGHWTGCTKEQHEAAVRLRDALLPLDDEAKS